MYAKVPQPSNDSSPSTAISLQLTHAPFTLLPTPFPKDLFHQANTIGPDFNLLVHQVGENTSIIIIIIIIIENRNNKNNWKIAIIADPMIERTPLNEVHKRGEKWIRSLIVD